MSQNGPRPHILALNDSADVLQLFDDLLSEEGFQVSKMAYATHDLDEIASLEPDPIILDYMWVGDDSGWSLLQMLRMSPKTSDIPIILCTGAVREVADMDARLSEMGVRVVLKPFDIDELVHVVNDVLAAATDQPRSTSEESGASPD